MNELISGLAASLTTIFIGVITHHLKQRISYGERWKKKKEQFDDIILKARELSNKEDYNCAERAYLENSIFSKFGWPMPAEAVTFLILKKNFPYNLETFHKSRRDIEFIDGKFKSKLKGFSKSLTEPKESHIKAYERIGLTLIKTWGLFATVLAILNIGFRYNTNDITAAFLTATPLVIFIVYLLGSTLGDMRRNKVLLDLNSE